MLGSKTDDEENGKNAPELRLKGRAAKNRRGN
jgi:hypothetical protein